MKEAPKCLKCGAPLTREARAGACPRCLFAEVVNDGEGDGFRTGATGEMAQQLIPPSNNPGTFGNYELIEEIARGGMGVVFKARQLSLNRVVAVKMILAGAFARREEILRFRAEAEVAAGLRHPNIVAVYETGEYEGVHYFSMDYVDGKDLTRIVREQGTLHPRQAARWTQSIAEAIQYAHEQGVLHRDLKPSNVIVDAEDRPHVMDFGLAKRVRGDFGLTVTGQVLGTPHFMPPEQCGVAACRAALPMQFSTRPRGHGKIGPWSDVYGIGAVLYFLLTGRPPYQADTVGELLGLLMGETEPVSPRLLNARVPADLETITLKSLDKDAARRYATAREMADELGRFLANEPIRARPLGSLGRAWRWCRRKPEVAVLSGVLALAVALAGLFAFQSHRQRQQSELDRRQASMDKAWLAAWSGDLQGAEEPIREAELAGASVGDIRMIRGVLTACSGRYDEAIKHLEQGVRLAPNSVAAQALLALTYSRVGEYARANRSLTTADESRPTTDADILFKALADAEWGEVDQAQAAVDGVMKHRPTLLAHLIRAQVRLNAALCLASVGAAEGAAYDANVVKAMLPNNPVAVTTSLMAHMILARFLESSKRPERAADALRQAAAEFEALRRYTNNLQATWGRVAYLKYQGDDQGVFAELQTVPARDRNPLLNFSYAVALYSRGDFRGALAVLEPHAVERGTVADFCRGYVLAELPNGREATLDEFGRLMGADAPPLQVLYYQTTLRLLGDKRKAMAVCRDLRARGALFSSRNEWYRRILDYCCGDSVSAEELLHYAGPAKGALSEAHFFIALTLLSEGDRVGAKEHFREAAATPAVFSFEYNWSRAFMDRLEDGPHWPPWIPEDHANEQEWRSRQLH